MNQKQLLSSRRRRLARAGFRLLFLTIIFLLVVFPPHTKLDLQLLRFFRSLSSQSPRVFSPPEPSSYLHDSLLTSGKIPNLIWRTFSTNNHADIVRASRNGSDPVKARIDWFRSWDNLNPAHLQIILNDAQCDAFVKSHFTPRVIAAYFKLPYIVQRADFVRYLMLYEFGGVYTDMDTQALFPIQEWMEGVAVGKVSKVLHALHRNHVPQREVSLIMGVEEFGVIGGRDQLTQWTTASAPGHPFLQTFIHRLTETILTSPDHVLNTIEAVVGLTGPAFWSKVFWEVMTERYPYYNFDDLRGLDRGKRVVDDVLVLGQVYFRYPGIYVRHFGDGETKTGWKNQKREALARNASVGGDLALDRVGEGSLENVKANHGIPLHFIHTELPREVLDRRGRKEGRRSLFGPSQRQLQEQKETARVLEMHSSWETMNSDILKIVFPLQDVERFVRGSFERKFWKAYQKIKGEKGKAVFGRLLLLYQFGGYIVLDNEAECHVPVVQWSENQGIRLIVGGPDETGFNRQTVLAATPRHEFVEQLLVILEKLLEGRNVVWDFQFQSAYRKALESYAKNKNALIGNENASKQLVLAFQ